jgi:hypothetical protein
MSLNKRLKIQSSFARLTLRVRAVLVIPLIVAACGGGGGSELAALPGTGGTGITAVTAMGPVAGFGSVVVNGIRFDDAAARVFIDGQEQARGDTRQLRLGMVAHVVGQKSSAAVTATSVIKASGTADRIEVWSIAQGTITALVSSGTFRVAGMGIVVDAGTVLSGAMSANDLNLLSVVKVWGLPMNADFSQWTATRIEVLGKTSSTISTGKVVLRGAVPTLNGFTVAGSETPLADGQLVRAVGSLASSAVAGTLTLSRLTKLGSDGATPPATGHAELEGFVTSLLSASTDSAAKVTRITIGATEIDTKDATVSPIGARIALGKRVEVQGNWSNGILVATKVSVRSASESQEVEMDAVIEEFTSVANFVVRGQRCDASATTRIEGGPISQLKVGSRVHLEGVKNGDVVRVTELEIK